MTKTEEQIDVQEIDPQIRHATIFEKFDALKKGEAFIIINDHDPQPLGYQMAAIRGANAFSWEYLEEGPETWRVRIGKKAG